MGLELGFGLGPVPDLIQWNTDKISFKTYALSMEIIMVARAFGHATNHG